MLSLLEIYGLLFLIAVKNVWADGLQGWPCKPSIQALSTESSGYNFSPFMPLSSFTCLLGFFLVVLLLLKRRRSEGRSSLGVRFVKIYGMESELILSFVKKKVLFHSSSILFFCREEVSVKLELINYLPFGLLLDK